MPMQSKKNKTFKNKFFFNYTLACVIKYVDKVQAKDCNLLQTYDAKNCRCLCKQNLAKPAAGTNPASCKSPLCNEIFLFLTF